MASVRPKSKADPGRSTATKPPATAGSGRNRGKRKSAGTPPKKGPQPLDRAPTGRIRGALREFLESERGFLSDAQSLLVCIAHSMDYSTHPSTGPYYPDVVGLAADLLGRRAADLDEMLIAGRLSAAAR